MTVNGKHILIKDGEQGRRQLAVWHTLREDYLMDEKSKSAVDILMTVDERCEKDTDENKLIKWYSKYRLVVGHKIADGGTEMVREAQT